MTVAVRRPPRALVTRFEKLQGRHARLQARFDRDGDSPELQRDLDLLADAFGEWREAMNRWKSPDA